MDVRIASLKSGLNDTLRIYNGKTKEVIMSNGTQYKRDRLVDTVFSLKTLSEELMEVVDEMVSKDTTGKCYDMLNQLNVLICDTMPGIMKSTYASMLNEEKEKSAKSEIVPNVEKEKHVVIVEDKDQKAFDENGWVEVKSKISDKLKDVPVKKATVTKNGHGYIVFPDKNSQKKAETVLKEDYKVTVSTKKQEKLLPKMKVFDLTDFKKDDVENLKESILIKNDVIRSLVHDNGLVFDVLFINENHQFAIIRVSPEIRTEILKYGTLFIGMQAHNVKDNFHLTQCFSCQQYGHKQDSAFCPNSRGNYTCQYCAEPHHSSKCSHKNDVDKHKCINCANSKYIQYNRGSCGHHTRSWSCPIVANEMQLLINRTAGMDGKKFLQ